MVFVKKQLFISISMLCDTNDTKPEICNRCDSLVDTDAISPHVTTFLHDVGLFCFGVRRDNISNGAIEEKKLKLKKMFHEETKKFIFGAR